MNKCRIKFAYTHEKNKMINFNEYKEQALKENPKMLDKDIYMSYLFEKELEQFDNVPKPKFKPWGKRKAMILISNL